MCGNRFIEDRLRSHSTWWPLNQNSNTSALKAPIVASGLDKNNPTIGGRRYKPSSDRNDLFIKKPGTVPAFFATFRRPLTRRDREGWIDEYRVMIADF
jgi:hypothetical protein